MSEEGFEEWDAEFLDQLIQIEELALPSSSSIAIPNPNPDSHAYHHPSHFPFPPPSLRNPPSFSPPRQLSQRTSTLNSFPRSSNATDSKCSTTIAAATTSLSSAPTLQPSEDDKELEIKRLKGELGLVSKQLSDLEQECSVLRKKRVYQPNNVSSKNEEKEAFLPNSEGTGTNSDREHGALGVRHPVVSQRFQNVDIAIPSKKAAGVQTDDSVVFAQGFSNELLTSRDLSKKLLAIWELPNNQILGRNIISNLFVTCQSDFHVLFGCTGMNHSVELKMDFPVCGSSNVDLQCPVNSHHTSDAAKVLHLYYVLTKINNGMAHLEALLEPLLDLCILESVIIVNRSLRILHMFLKDLLSFERKFGDRDNIMVDGLCSGNNTSHHPGSGTAEKTDIISIIEDENSYLYAGYLPLTKLSDEKTIYEKGKLSSSHGSYVSRVDWVSLFNIMLQTAMRITEESARLEAVSIMNIILIRCNPYTERENITGCRFGNTQVFESILKLLRKETGLNVQKHSIRLLFLLLNCPKLLAMFCSGCTERKDTGSKNDTTEDRSATLQGLADCVACSGNGVEELKLRRNAIVLLAILASSGKSGFDILVSHKLSKDANFLMLILQVMVSEIDTEATIIPDSYEIFKERTLLMREALILLNRLVSNPVYSVPALQLLTKNRDMAGLSIDIANRLARKDVSGEFDDTVRMMRESEVIDERQRCGLQLLTRNRDRACLSIDFANRLARKDLSDQFYDMMRMMRESEIVDLARGFRKRVFTYMGDHTV
ncbi:protein SENSITIVE TO UV 2 isoform X1 [Cannabis sativa]|uniref:protein SENSITIVE TO UV 2 isoform X1 n=1 Tax=Cannabis sativa TaxID=3483 RepID=UPI0029C9F523|nr:protein SENSITIVE TO UV 2 isoform X1 [Cannabis sativa]